MATDEDYPIDLPILVIEAQIFVALKISNFCQISLSLVNNVPVQTPSEIVSTRKPFVLGVQFDSSEPTAHNNRGFYLFYRQYSC